MEKLYALDLLKKETFDGEVIDKDKNVLYPQDSPITKDIISILYFKECYMVNKNIPKEEIDIEAINEQAQEAIEQVNKVEEEKEEPIVQKQNDAQEDNLVQDGVNSESEGEEPQIVQAPQQEIFEEQEEIKEEPQKKEIIFDSSKFDEVHADSVVELSVKIARLLMLKIDDTEIVKKVAYYHDIKNALSDDSDNAVVEYLTQNKDIPEIIAREVVVVHKKFDTSDFFLNKDFRNEFPPSNIVSIANAYVNFALKGKSKEEILLTMLRIGGARYNIFILHKFIDFMRKIDE